MTPSPLRVGSVEHRCGERDVRGQICGKTFSRAFNLQRHISEVHQATLRNPIGTHFINLVPNCTILPHGPPPPSPPPPPLGVIATQKPTETPYSPLGLSLLQQTVRSAVQQAIRAVLPLRLAQTSSQSPAPACPLPGDLELPTADTSPKEPQGSERGPSKRRLLLRGGSIQAVPVYNVPMSRLDLQQRGISWLSEDARVYYENTIKTIMHSWGVDRGHAGTCVIHPAAWEAADVAVLCKTLTPENCPKIGDAHTCFTYRDHQTLLARGGAWFCTWPRRGIDLDNFLESGPFVRQDGSHLCHCSLCVNPNHICLEPCDINQDRIECYQWAVRMRRNGQTAEIPPTCTAHDPPCLLHHAVLSTAERVMIQISVRRQASGEPEPNRTWVRPRPHTFMTFESRLPLSIFKPDTCPVRVIPSTLLTPTQHLGRPHTMCVFCKSPKTYAKVLNYWRHIVGQHSGVRDSDRLAEIRRTAAIWSVSMSQRGADMTRVKIAEAMRSDFTWARVESWGLWKRKAAEADLDEDAAEGGLD